MRHPCLLILGCSIALVAIAQASSAEEHDDGAIEYRQNVMRALGGHTGAMALILKGEGGAEKDLRLHAQAVVALATVVPELFPVGSDAGRTNALPDIWLEPARFRQRLAELQRGVDQLKRGVGRSRRQFAQALQALAAACRGCHDRYKSN